MNHLEVTTDVVVVGAGHAGCEASLACARLGLKTVMFTVSVDSIALMPCNPNVGGSSKGHLVREIDALGGEMGKNIDHTFIQSKMLNGSKGPAVHSLRAQADKRDYSSRMRKTLENTPNLTIKQAEVTEIIVEDGNAYAIEYDCINSLQLKSTLEFKKIRGLFAGGQFNGSSGYEEAAVQGFMAGVNASMEVLGREQVVLDRSQAYIGVLIDDLVTKENHEPYRMMTSRAEYRLLLRQDNADLRLREIGHNIGLVSDEEYEHLLEKKAQIDAEIERLEKATIGGTPKVQELLAKYESTPLKSGTTLAELIKRPELDYEKLAEVDEKRPELAFDVQEQVNIEIKYEGYIKRQMQQVAQFKKLEGRKLPETICYEEIHGLRIEAQQKLNLFRPISVGQASRISGVSPADISVLLIYMEQMNRHPRHEE